MHAPTIIISSFIYGEPYILYLLHSGYGVSQFSQFLISVLFAPRQCPQLLPQLTNLLVFDGLQFLPFSQLLVALHTLISCCGVQHELVQLLGQVVHVRLVSSMGLFSVLAFPLKILFVDSSLYVR